MKTIFKMALLGLFFVSLIGCDNNAKFDRVNASSEYSGIVEYTPNSRNIKKQIINTYIGNLVAYTLTIETDNKGRITKSIIKYNEEVHTRLGEMEQFIDYNSLKFNLDVPMFSISVQNGNLILDDKGRVNKALSKDGVFSLLNEYEDNKLVSSSIINSNSILKTQNHWDNDVITKVINTISNFSKKKLIRNETTYHYDEQNRLTQSKIASTFFSDIEVITFFDGWNEFGDWTVAKVASDFGYIKTTHIRRIEYW